MISMLFVGRMGPKSHKKIIVKKRLHFPLRSVYKIVECIFSECLKVSHLSKRKTKMKRLEVIALIALFVVPSICMADMYSRIVHYRVNIYAYEGPNGERLGDITRTRGEWWSTCAGSSVPGIGSILPRRQQSKSDVSEKSNLTGCWKILRDFYNAERTIQLKMTVNGSVIRVALIRKHPSVKS